VAGIITAHRKLITRSGRMMAFFTLEDLTAQIEATLLPDAYEKCGDALVDQAIVIVRGRSELDDRWREDREPGGQLRLLAEAIAPLDDQEAVSALRQSGNHGRERNARSPRRSPRPSSQPNTPAPSDAAPPPQPSQRVHIRVSAEAAPETVGQLKEMIGQFHGDTEVLLHIHAGQRERRLRLGRAYLVARDERFTNAVRNLLGDGAVWVE
jgi:DNA polymerase III alpha subunit